MSVCQTFRQVEGEGVWSKGEGGGWRELEKERVRDREGEQVREEGRDAG